MNQQVDFLLPALTPCLIDSPGVNGTVTRAPGVMQWSQHGTSLGRLLTCLAAFEEDSGVT